MCRACKLLSAQGTFQFHLHFELCLNTGEQDKEPHGNGVLDHNLGDGFTNVLFIFNQFTYHNWRLIFIACNQPICNMFSVIVSNTS